MVVVALMVLNIPLLLDSCPGEKDKGIVVNVMMVLVVVVVVVRMLLLTG